MRNYIHSLPITDILLNDFAKCGVDKNLDSKSGVVWQHFFVELPRQFVVRDAVAKRGFARETKNMLQRALNELTVEATETILELTAQGSLYRGSEFKGLLEAFLKIQREYVYTEAKDNFCWVKSENIAVSRIRNTAIGTFLIDLSEGMELDEALTRYERVVAPANYKRPTAAVTPKMIQQAKDKLAELGLLDSIERRYATSTDLNISDVLYTATGSGIDDVFASLAHETSVNPRKLTKVEEISIEDFLSKIVPTAKSVEVLLENKHLANMVSLLTGQHADATTLFKWDNQFSWSYTGGVTDSIKERVKAAGGAVEGELRVSLSWGNYDDLDLHVHEPDKNLIYYGNKVSSRTHGRLDVDMNAGRGTTRTPVENIIWQDKGRMLEGKYKVLVHNFCKREMAGSGYTVQIEHGGEIYEFAAEKNPPDGVKHAVATFTYSKNNGIVFEGDVKSNVSTKEKWGLQTNRFHTVSKIMLSPNHWQQTVGNKHYLFFLEGCVSDETPRPFFNEFLKQELNQHRKVFEILAGKMTVPQEKNQLSGVGFSETLRNSVIVQVSGKFKRMLKVNF